MSFGPPGLIKSDNGGESHGGEQGDPLALGSTGPPFPSFGVGRLGGLPI